MRAVPVITRRGWGRVDFATRHSKRGQVQRRRSLVPRDVPQLVQRPPDSMLLERQFRPPAGLDSFNVNDEIRLLYVPRRTVAAAFPASPSPLLLPRFSFPASPSPLLLPRFSFHPRLAHSPARTVKRARSPDSTASGSCRRTCRSATTSSSFSPSSWCSWRSKALSCSVNWTRIPSTWKRAR